ncbi:hypothetical protein E2C01_059297 [Portunus trituberculatus]|uniref:Uncharacterized protein n=1 Tax=Portunus trituberculatus TaxID=210409 RepID=A0A5B7H767_PORTR|nr:hypothetical protein [Portunus trituberculatus]
MVRSGDGGGNDVIAVVVVVVQGTRGAPGDVMAPRHLRKAFRCASWTFLGYRATLGHRESAEF